ncbi:MAG TPA: AAA family ATPase [Gemmatimonadales bacterium]
MTQRQTTSPRKTTPATPVVPPPHDLELERALLGAALLYTVVARTVSGIDRHIFFDQAHQDVARAIAHLVDRDELVDPTTVHIALAATGAGVQARAKGFVTELVVHAASTTAIAMIVHRLQEMALARRALGMVDELISGARNVNGWRSSVANLAELATVDISGGQPLEQLGVVDIGARIANGIDPPRFIHPWLYASGLTIIWAEPGVGKTWLAEHLAATVMEAGYATVYIDVDSTAEVVAERLAALQADPDLVAERFVYANPTDTSWNSADFLHVRALLGQAAHRAPLGLGLVIVDALADMLTAADVDEDRAPGVTAMLSQLANVVRPTGAALLVLDHIQKPANDGKRHRSRYGRGSGAKLAKADAALLLEVEEEFSVDQSGRLRLWVTKDRRGRLSLPRLGRPGLRVDVHAAGGLVSFIERGATADNDDEDADWTGPTACMDAVLNVLDKYGPEPISMSRLTDLLPAEGHRFRATTIRAAAEKLTISGRVHTASGARGARLFSLPTATPGDMGAVDDHF